ncbi:MAG: hypothetical protein KC620_16840, partial [Myxococcales bacterium]|nr:hypothetical protein [Myxococcales bacterium]
MRFPKFPAALILAAGLGSCVTVDTEMPHETLVTDWRDEIIYQVMIDRFEDGDPSNNYNVDYFDETSYHGGDWQGLIDRLDYIEALGVTTLWISPVVRNVEEDAGFASYHGYWTQDFLKVNPHFGDLSKLQDLVREAHARGLKVVLDIVTNHVGQVFYYDINRNRQPDIVFYGGGGAGQGSQADNAGNQGSRLRRVSEWDPEYDYRGIQAFTSLGENGPAPVVFVESPEINRTPPNPPGFQNPLWYNRKGRVTVWEDECQCFNACDGSCDGLYNPYKNACTWDCWGRLREQEKLGDFPGGLKDLDTERDDVRQALIRAFQYWLEVGDFDGFRIDTLKHQETGFFDLFAPAMRAHAKKLGKKNFFMFGEAFDGKDFLLGEYTHGTGVDSVFYFSAKYQIFDDVFGRGGPTANVKSLYDGRRAMQRYGPPSDGSMRPRYNDQPKPDGPTDAEGNGLNSQQLVVHFMDNHDVPRWLYSFPGEYARFRNALAFLLTTDGIPCIYYGTEQDLAGGPDPSNREDMWQTGFGTDGETFRHVQKMIRLRKTYAPLRRGDLRFVRTSNHRAGDASPPPDAGILAFERSYQGETALVVFNTHPTQTSRTADADGPMQT